MLNHATIMTGKGAAANSASIGVGTIITLGPPESRAKFNELLFDTGRILEIELLTCILALRGL